MCTIVHHTTLYSPALDQNHAKSALSDFANYPRTTGGTPHPGGTARKTSFQYDLGEREPTACGCSGPQGAAPAGAAWSWRLAAGGALRELARWPQCMRRGGPTKIVSTLVRGLSAGGSVATLSRRTAAMADARQTIPVIGAPTNAHASCVGFTDCAARCWARASSCGLPCFRPNAV